MSIMMLIYSKLRYVEKWSEDFHIISNQNSSIFTLDDQKSTTVLIIYRKENALLLMDASMQVNLILTIQTMSVILKRTLQNGPKQVDC